MIIRRSESELYNRPCIIFRDDIIKYGWEKAILIGEIPQCVYGDGSLMEEKDLYQRFPFFTKDKFYSLLNELVELGLAFREERDNG